MSYSLPPSTGSHDISPKPAGWSSRRSTPYPPERARNKEVTAYDLTEEQSAFDREVHCSEIATFR